VRSPISLSYSAIISFLSFSTIFLSKSLNIAYVLGDYI
jgi:hypothetical protein